MDQRSGDGQINGRSSDVAINSRPSNFWNFEMLDAKIASALQKIITNPYFKKKVSLEEHKDQMEDRFLRVIPKYFPLAGAHESVLDYTDLFSVTLHGDDIQDFDTRWDQAQLSASEVLNDKILKSLCRM